ncbi:DUF4935 domain-containing protein [Bacillus halotolerans]|uniref:PIN domain-containing protein n=1 Tax=Bacillus halotolerans TaxID=260554 RepID=UPI001C0F1794|nr:PIN domain-containing protein [Bacillus halotolerans]MBU5245256.1 DUF4935 domain-containing protein [Bacillus halotolerans]
MNIFLDTQVYHSKNFNLQNKDFLRLEKFIDDEMIKLYITPITKNEIENHIKQKIEDSREYINTFKENAKILLNYDLYRPIWDRKTIKQAEIKILEDFHNFLIENNVEEIPISGDATKQIFQNYFEGETPFSSKKKDEFPDAFALYSLLNWAENNEEIIHVVSGDNDLKNFCESKENILHIESLEKALDFLNQHDEVRYRFAQRLYDDQLAEFVEYINDSIRDGSAELNIDAYDVLDVELKDFFVEGEDDLSADPLFLDLEENRLTIALNVEFNIHIITSAIDPARSPYDSEEGKYLYVEYEENEFMDVIRIPVELELDVEDYENQYYTIESITINNGQVYYYTILEDC